MISTTTDITRNLAGVKADIARYAERHGRRAEDIQLLAVSKTKPLSAIEAAMTVGQRAFGENYVDEAVEKITALNSRTDTGDPAEWHFIGAIQSRKTALIATHFQWAHGVDREKLIRRLAAQRPDHLPPLKICLQVNLDEEASKAGAGLDELPALAAACADLPALELRGLMAIPAPRTELDEQRAVLSTLRRALTALQTTCSGMDTLSMGMSGDLEAAIAEGATIVRVGSAIFGARDTPGPA